MKLEKVRTLWWLALIVLCVGCGQGAEEAPAGPGPRVENAEVGVAIAELPAYFQVSANEGTSLVLVPADGEAGVTLEVIAGEFETGGINLVAASQDFKTAVEEEGGKNYGADPTEYFSENLGTVMYNRARFDTNTGPVDEMRVFVIHPWGDRNLQFRYRYPATGEPEGKQARVDQLMGVVGETEGLGEPPDSAEED